MRIKVEEKCETDFNDIELEDFEQNRDTQSYRTIVYNSPKNTLLEAFQDYITNFDSNRIINFHNEFDGNCIKTLKYLSVSEVKYEVDVWNINK